MIGGQRKDFIVINTRQDIHCSGDVLDLLQGCVTENVASFHAQHQRKRLSAAIMRVELAIKQSVRMIAWEEILETRCNPNAGSPISHEDRYGDQYQADWDAELQDVSADTEFISAARFVHRPPVQ